MKWDYELRGGQPVEAVVDRALDIAMSEPRGPVYLTLPREVLMHPTVSARRDTVRPLGATAPEPSHRAIEEAANLLANAEFPLIVTASVGRNHAAVGALAALADAFAIPVVQSEARDLNLPTDHAMNMGFEAGAVLPKADVILVLDSIVPWMPRAHVPRRDAKIIHVAADPLATRYPFRDFEADLVIAGDPFAALSMLHAALADATKGKSAAMESRRKAAAAAREDLQTRQKKLLDTVKDQSPIHPAWLAHCVNQVKSEDAIIVNELGLSLPHLHLSKPGSFLGNLLSGGLGFGLGAGARRQARGSRARGDRRRRRRLVYFRQSAALSLCRARGEPADAHHHRQQPRLGCGSQRYARCIPGRSGGESEQHAADGAETVAGL